MTNTHTVVNRVIQEVAGTIATNGIQELNKDERGYVCVCLKSTAYNAVRSMPGFDMSYGDFCRAVDSTVDAISTPNWYGAQSDMRSEPRTEI